jgi:hypothetical protein
MILRDFKNKRIIGVYILFIIVLSSFLTFTINHNIKLSQKERFEGTEFTLPNNPQLSAQETLTAVWLENPTFEDPIEPTWYSELDGDLSDIETTAGSGNLNLKVIGDSREMRIDDPLSDLDWTNFNNPLYPIEPDSYGINASGCYISHTWHEGVDQTRNTPSMQWKRNVTMPVNMSDYIITTASLEVSFNASVQALDHDGGGIEVDGDYTEGQFPPGDTQYGIGDSATFYAQLSDLDNNFSSPIASNKTSNLGQDSGPTITSHPDTPLNVISEDLLISYLTSVLSVDGFNFTITLGIDIYCEDNEWNVDIDIWRALIIRSFNLTFTYEKKINQFSLMSWNQDGGQINDVSNDTVIINEARLNFKYRIDKNWTESSPNSEIRAYINNNKLSETIKLSEANSSFQEAKLGGFDVTSLIPYNTNINFSIQVFLADEFSLDQNTTISLDDLYLNITYTVIFPAFQTNIQLFFDGVNKTSNPKYDHPVGNDLNITVKYPDEVGNHISGAVVQLSGNLTGTLTEDIANKQYTIIIDANDMNVGIFLFKIVAHKINFELSTINPELTVTPTETQALQLFLNGEDKTLDPLVDIPLDSLINITIKYKTLLGTPITGATITLLGEGIIETLNESVVFNQYSVFVNSSIKLIPDANLLKVEAKKLNYEDQEIEPRITVRKINAVITAVNNTDTLGIQPGEDANIQVYINNTDINEIIKGAIVTYSWDQIDGILDDADNDGIYEVIILNVPVGTHSIIINAFGGDKYDFISLEFIVVASKPADASFLFRILLILGIVVSIGLSGYLYAYQKVLKYPKTVRKVRKYRRTLKKENSPRIDIKERKKSFNSAYHKELSKTSKFLKGKPTATKPPKTKSVKKTPESANVDLTTEPKNQNSNAYNLDNINKQKSIKFGIFRKFFKIKLRKFWYGSFTSKKRGRSFYALIIIAIIVFSSVLIIPLFSQNTFLISNNSVNSLVHDNIDNLGMSAQASFTKQWLNNTSFDAPIEPIWFPLYGELGDNSDVKALPDTGQVNYTVIGDSGTVSIDNVLNDTDWSPTNNPDLPILPDTYIINSEGCFVSHLWDENINQTRNRPSVHWKRTVTMPVNMSDYIITSASIEVIFNATVSVSPHAGAGGGIDRQGDSGLDDYSSGDSADFYAFLTDVDESIVPIPIATNNTGIGNLGQDSPSIGSFPDTPMDTIPESVLIDALTSVLSTNSRNFTITLGIDIYCEDNEAGADVDRWNSLIIRSFNLTFTYEKKINQFTSVSWNQNADRISDISNDTVVVDKALLNFKYKIDQNWTSSSSNSEFRILINENQHPETVKLNTANTTFQEAKVGGFDVTSLIIDEVNLSIEVFLADEFSLDNNITISIDDVILNVSYTIIFPDKETDLHLYLDTVNKTDDPNVDIFIGDSLNITVKYLNKSGVHIPNATVQLSGNFTGDIEEDQPLDQYTLILNTTVSDAGVNFLTIIAQAEDHETRVINIIVRINKFTTENLQVILNTQNVTHDPYIELTVSEILNVTVKYNSLGWSHITGANVLLTSETFTSYLNESVAFEQYSILIDTNKSLKTGANYLTVEAQAETFQTEEVDIIITVNKINVQIEPLSGSNTIESKTGADIRLRVRLNNTDFGGFITGAIITYTWGEGGGILEDPDNDGIYEDIIPNFPEGTYPIEISAFVGDDFYIEDYEIIVAATSEEQEENIIFPILFTVSMILITGLAIYLYAYQAFLKFPKQVRKVRKFRKSLKRKAAPNVVIIGRESAFKTHYNANLGKFTRDLKLKRHPGTAKTVEQKLPPQKEVKKSLEPKIEQEKLTEKVMEKKDELDDLIKDSSKDASK